MQLLRVFCFHGQKNIFKFFLYMLASVLKSCFKWGRKKSQKKIGKYFSLWKTVFRLQIWYNLVYVLWSTLLSLLLNISLHSIYNKSCRYNWAMLFNFNKTTLDSKIILILICHPICNYLLNTYLRKFIASISFTNLLM